MSRHAVWGAVVLLVLIAVPSTSVSAQQDRFAGCYDLYLGEWQPPAPGADSTYFAVPTRVRLSMEPGESFLGRGQEFAVVVVPGALPSMHRYAWWRPTEGDGIEIVWSTGFTGVRADMSRANGDTLRGEGVTFTDVHPSTNHRALLVAAPVRCDAPVPPERQLYHRYPRSVHLSAGDSIALGDHVPRGIELDSVGRQRFRLDAEVAPPFHGADRIELSIGEDDRVEWMRLEYPDDVDFDTVLTRLTTELGAPTYAPAGRLRATSWASRTVSIGLQQGRTDSPGVTVHVRIP